MSSNAFARSRPRVRHQRVPKTPSYAHPRFLKLVKELSRIDEAKKKLVEPTPESNLESSNLSTKEGLNVATNRRDDCQSSSNQIREQIPAQTSHPRFAHTNNHEYHGRGSSPRHQQHGQQHINLLCCSGLGSLNYPSCATSSNSSQAYRSLGLNLTQTSSALHDNYYRHNDGGTQEHMQNQSYPGHHNRDYSYPSIQQESPSQGYPGIHHSHHIDYRSLNKCPSSTSSTTTSLGYPKTAGIQQQNQPQNNDCNPGVRQDENRSKRKRSSNDASSAARKCSPNPSSPPACSKRHKSSPEPPRPLSPSFTKCPICLLDCMDRDPSFTNTCFHLFCFVCIENWSKSKATCPLCRTKFSKIIYNIRSESCFEEKVASPLRRDDEDDRFTYEQLTHSMLHPRNPQIEEARLLFDNLRNNDVLMPHLVFTNQQIDPRQVDLRSFTSVTNNANFSSAVPHGPFPSNYGQMGPNYIALIPSNNRLPSNPSSSAITSAYPGSANLTSISNDSIGRTPRVSRSGRYIYSRNHDLANVDAPARGSRSLNVNLNPSGLSLDSRQHHHLANPSQHQHQTQQQHRSTVATIEIGPTRLSHSQNIHLPYHIPSRNYTNPSLYSRRTYNNPPMDQHILDEFYPQIPEL